MFLVTSYNMLTMLKLGMKRRIIIFILQDQIEINFYPLKFPKTKQIKILTMNSIFLFFVQVCLYKKQTSLTNCLKTLQQNVA